MIVEFALKIIIATGILFLLIMYLNSQTSENFAVNNVVNISMRWENDMYVFVGFNQLNENYKNIIIPKLLMNDNFMIQKEKQDHIVNGKFYKTPVFIVKTSLLNKISNGKKLDFIMIPIDNKNNFALTPIDNNIPIYDKYLYWDENIDMLYYTSSGDSKFSVNVINDQFAKPKNIGNDTKYGELDLKSFTTNTVSTNNVILQIK
jgi:hypothetical protein